MYLLDTDTLTLFHIGHPLVVERVTQASGDVVATTIITAMEILRGRYDAVLKAANGKELALAQEKLSRSQALLEDCHIVAIEKFATAEFDMLLQHKKLHKIGRADLLIASIALARRDTLVTRNLKHFQQVPRLKVENWAD